MHEEKSESHLVTHSRSERRPLSMQAIPQLLSRVVKGKTVGSNFLNKEEILNLRRSLRNNDNLKHLLTRYWALRAELISVVIAYLILNYLFQSIAIQMNDLGRVTVVNLFDFSNVGVQYSAALAAINSILLIPPILSRLPHSNAVISALSKWQKQTEKESVLLAIDAALQKQPLAGLELAVQGTEELVGTSKDSSSYLDHVGRVIKNFDQAILPGRVHRWKQVIYWIWTILSISMFTLINYVTLGMALDGFRPKVEVLPSAFNFVTLVFILFRYSRLLFPSSAVREFCTRNILDCYMYNGK